MWRAFFFAVGTMLIILGVECLVVERFVVQRARIPAAVAKVLDGTSKKVEPGGNIAQALSPSNQNPGSASSSFGPSRFSDNFSNPGGYYGGVPSSRQSSNPNSGFSLAGFGQQSTGIAPLTEARRNASQSPSSTRIRIIQPKDWMPWSLLAAGTLVVLYTNTTSGRGFAGGD